MKTLKLTLTRYWFDMMKRGEKLEEYREIKMYWVTRFVHNPNNVRLHESIYPTTLHSGFFFSIGYANAKINNCGPAIDYMIKQGYEFKNYDFVQARNGYGKLDPVITWKPGPIRIGLPRAEWCAPGTDLTKPVFIIPVLKLLN